jgi:ABC-type ATPase involved in cell division
MHLASFQTKNNQSQTIELKPSAALFLVGANGSGKSALLNKIFQDNLNLSTRIWASRTNTFQNEKPAISAMPTYSQVSNNYTQFTTPILRTKDPFGHSSGDGSVSRLVASQLEYLSGRGSGVLSPLDTINKLLFEVGIEIKLETAGLELKATKNNSESFELSHLSDGERNAILLAAECISVPNSWTILIDEPEKNLYRRISARLISLLIGLRSDCRWVIATHDHELVANFTGPCKLFIIRGVEFNGGHPTSWEIDEIVDKHLMPDGLILELVGPKRQILIVEGTESSHDIKIYSALFGKTWHVLPGGDCLNVAHKVTALKGVAELTWLRCYGITDKDFKVPASDRESLRSISFYSIESFLISSTIRNALVEALRVLRNQTDAWREERIDQIDKRFRELLTGAQDHLLAKRIKFEHRAKLMAEMGLALRANPAEVKLDSEIRTRETELKHDFDLNLREAKLDSIIRDYPIKETGLLKACCTILDISNESSYVEQVSGLLARDQLLHTKAIELLGLQALLADKNEIRN